MRINLLPPGSRRHLTQLASILSILFLLASVGLPPAYYVFKLNENNARLTQQNQGLEVRIAELKPVSDLLQQKASIEGAIRSLQSATGTRQNFETVPYLAELSLVLPASITVNELQLDQHKLTIRGEVPNYVVAGQMLQSFITSTLFDAPTMTGLTESGSTYRFELSATVKIGGSK